MAMHKKVIGTTLYPHYALVVHSQFSPPENRSFPHMINDLDRQMELTKMLMLTIMPVKLPYITILIQSDGRNRFTPVQWKMHARSGSFVETK